MRIALDLDGVTIDSITAWLKQFHPNYTRNDIYKYNVWEIIDCTKEQFFDEFGKLDARCVSLNDNARNVILRLAKQHEVFFLTSKSLEAQNWTEMVLAREGLGEIPLINNWLEGKRKIDYDYDILLDDSPINIGDRTIIFDRPWNRDLKGKRVYSWNEFEDYLKTFL